MVKTVSHSRNVKAGGILVKGNYACIRHTEFLKAAWPIVANTIQMYMASYKGWDH